MKISVNRWIDRQMDKDPHLTNFSLSMKKQIICLPWPVYPDLSLQASHVLLTFFSFFCDWALSGLQDFSFPIRDWTRAPCSGSTESQPLDHQGSLLSFLTCAHVCLQPWARFYHQDPLHSSSLVWGGALLDYAKIFKTEIICTCTSLREVSALFPLHPQ